MFGERPQDPGTATELNFVPGPRLPHAKDISFLLSVTRETLCNSGKAMGISYRLFSENSVCAA